MKILLVVPDGVAIRNYIYTSLISKLMDKGAEIQIYHRISNSAIDEINKIYNGKLKFVRISDYSENIIGTIIRETNVYARLLRNKKVLDNETIMDFWNKNQKTTKRKILYKTAEIFGFFVSKSNKSILFLDIIYEKLLSKNVIIKTITKDLNDFKPDIILNLHQRSTISAPIALVAKQLKIKTATVIFSWDNVPKARLIARYDYYLVWSELMKSEICALYDEINPLQVIVTGTPQFEFYFKKELYVSKENFFEKFGLDVNKKTICFSANDQSSPYEANYFNDICEALNKMDETIRPQIVLRKSPVDITNRFDATLQKYATFVFRIDPDWCYDTHDEKSFSTIFPAINDNTILVNTVKHADLVINLGSTMAHDFAVLNKPCLYLNYNPVKNSNFPVEKVYNFQHFKSMKDLSAVGWINSKSEINSKIVEALNSPELVASDRIKWMQKIVKFPLEESSDNIVNFLMK